MDLLVSYSWGQFYRAKPEILRLLHRFGDSAPMVEKTAVMGIAVVHTCLDNRAVIRRCRELLQAEPNAFESAIKWVPADHWCDTELDAIKQTIVQHVTDRIASDESWAMKVHKRRWQAYHTDEIVRYLATAIERTVKLDRPDWVVWVDIVGRTTAVSLLRPDDIFSLNLPHP
jgi:tRNA(Ser,Leu) C12 N-acetylase TAN1